MQKPNLLLVGLFLLGVVAVAQDASFRIDPSTDFSKYRTYKWVHALKGNHATYPVDPQVTEALDAELPQKGLKKTDSDAADLLICYHSNFGTEKFNRYNSEFEGTLVWRNTADINPKARPKDIAKAVSKLLKNYPPKK